MEGQSSEEVSGRCTFYHSNCIRYIDSNSLICETGKVGKRAG